MPESSFTEDGNPIPLVYEGAGRFVAPNAYWRALCDERFEKNYRYVFVPQLERSWKSHKHFFASIQEAWSNLPERYVKDYPSPEHLRKSALVACGYYTQRQFVCAKGSEALKLAAFLREDKDTFAIIGVHDTTVVERRPLSQSVKTMGREKFQASKTDVMSYAWGIVGVDPREASGEVGSHA